VAGTAPQLCLGTVYAWSYFQKPLATTYTFLVNAGVLAAGLLLTLLLGDRR
jgi:hypothetical protein